MNLYEIDSRIREIATKAYFNNGRMSDDDVKEFVELHMEKEQKIENVALMIKNLKAENVAIKAEIDGFRARLKSNEGKITMLEKWLIEATECRKYQSAKCVVSFMVTHSVNITDMDKIPSEYIREKTETVPDKNAIKLQLLSGETVPGAKLETNTHTHIV